MNVFSAVSLGVLLVSVLLLIAALVFGFGHDTELAHEFDASHETNGVVGPLDVDPPLTQRRRRR